MVRGFYTLGSGMLTQNRVMGAVSNNIANVNTPGFKKSRVLQTSFGVLLLNRIDSHRTPFREVSLINAAEKSATVFSQGPMTDTGRSLDFAIRGKGFFAVQNENGIFYTREGSFSLDEEGFLTLFGKGRIMGLNGSIYLGTDSFDFDGAGNLTAGGMVSDRPAVYDFGDYSGIRTLGNGLYEGGDTVLMNNPEVLWKTLEGSNVDPAEQISDAISAQRSLQLNSQALKMYDQVLSKAAAEIAKI